MDAAISRANEIPGSARTDAAAGALEFLRNTCAGVPPTCLADLVDEADVADNAGAIAYNAAADEITEPKRAMLELKKRALEAPDPGLVEALRQALGDAYDNRTVTVVVSLTEPFGDPFSYTIYSAEETDTLIDPDPAARIDASESDLSLLDEPYPPAP